MCVLSARYSLNDECVQVIVTNRAFFHEVNALGKPAWLLTSLLA